MWTTRSEKIYVAILLLVACLFEGYYTFYVDASPLSQQVYEALQSRSVNFNKAHNIKNKTGKESSVLINDSSIARNWGLMGTSEADIRAMKAWEISKGSRDVVVAVIDTGIDVQHEDLKNNLWKNQGEVGLDSRGRSKATNKIDDDGNGFVDDVYGWNFVSNNKDIKDHHGHGTHVAGIIGAEGSNGKGISGVSPKVSLMILKYYDPRFPNTDNLKNTVMAIEYAVKMGAKIINYSGGGVQYSKHEFNAIKKARDKGILFIAAAGNEKSNSNKSDYYPAKYNLDNIISVTAINRSTKVLSSSNWGDQTVHIAAPGDNIRSTLPNNRYGEMTGTSQATAFVSGVSSLLYAQNKEFNYLDVKNQILSTADEKRILRSKTITSGKLNAWAALAMKSSSMSITGQKDDLHHNLPVDFVQNTAGIHTINSVGHLKNQPSSQIKSNMGNISEILRQASEQ